MAEEKKASGKAEADNFTQITNALFDLGRDFIAEFWRGIYLGTLPWHICSGLGSVLVFLFMKRWDAYVWRLFHIAPYYPFHPLLYWPYALMAVTSPFWIWGLRRVAYRRRLIERLSVAFKDAGLQTRMGRLPGFISDGPVDTHMRKLTLMSAGIPEVEFRRAKELLETSLQISIEKVKSDVPAGRVDILYAHGNMPEHVNFEPDPELTSLEFAVGATRSSMLTVSLKDVPHLLVAGYTNSGKSTFLRQMLATLILKNRDLELSLIDLKAGLEFQVFQGLKNVSLSTDTASALQTLKHMEGQLEKRMALLWANRVNDLTAYFKVPESKRKYPPSWPKGKTIARHIIVIDEAAELFLAGAMLSGKDTQVARRCAAKIAALGRAVGIHLVVATQRPDRNAVDPIIKANLQGRLCFQMADNPSSMTILDSVRAADLPPVRGRAIWRSGFDLTEVQVPWLSRETLEVLLKDLREEKAAEDGAVPTGSIMADPEPTSSPKDAIDEHDEARTARAPKTGTVPS